VLLCSLETPQDAQVSFAQRILGITVISSSFDAIIVANFGAAVAAQDHNGVLYRAIPLKKLPHLVAGDRVSWQPT